MTINKSTKILEMNMDENNRLVDKTIIDSDISEEILVVKNKEYILSN